MSDKTRFYIFCIFSINIFLIYSIFIFTYTFYLFLYLLNEIIKTFLWSDYNGIDFFFNNIQIYFFKFFYNIWLNFSEYIYNEDKELILNPDYNFIKKHPYFIDLYWFTIFILIFVYLVLVFILIRYFELENLSSKLVEFTAKNSRFFLKFLFLIIFLLFFF